MMTSLEGTLIHDYVDDSLGVFCVIPQEVPYRCENENWHLYLLFFHSVRRQTGARRDDVENRNTMTASNQNRRKHFG